MGYSDPLDVAVGARLRTIRLWRGMSQDALAQAAGVTFQQIQKYESGRNRISASMLARVAAALETPVGAFFGEGSKAAARVDAAAKLLSEAGAIELLRAFGGIRSSTTRQQLIALLAGLRP